MTRAEYDRLCELQRWLIFSVCVANKTEKHAMRVTRGLMDYNLYVTPFDCIKELVDAGRMESALRDLHSGQYTRLTKCLTALVNSNLDLATCTPADLEAIPGVGPKTARYFIMETRPGAEYAALDTHVLKWMRAQGYDAPKSTPTGKKYAELEAVFIAEAKKRGQTARELDLEVWSQYAVGMKQQAQLAQEAHE